MNILKTIIMAFLLLIIPIKAISSPSIYVDSLEDAISLSEDTKIKVLAIFSADWCSFCSKTKEDIKKNIKEYEDIIIVYIDIDKREDLKKEYKVKKIPDYMLLKGSKEIKRVVGYLNNPNLIKFIKDDK